MLFGGPQCETYRMLTCKDCNSGSISCTESMGLFSFQFKTYTSLLYVPSLNPLKQVLPPLMLQNFLFFFLNMPTISSNTFCFVSVTRSLGMATREAWLVPSRPPRPILPFRSRLKLFTRLKGWWERTTPRRKLVQASPVKFPTSSPCPLQSFYRNPTLNLQPCLAHLQL